MKGQRGGHNPELLGNDAGRQSFGTARHEQPEQFETGFLGESAECCDRAFLIHRGLSQKFYVSTIIKYMLLTAWDLVKHILRNIEMRERSWAPPRSRNWSAAGTAASLPAVPDAAAPPPHRRKSPAAWAIPRPSSPPCR